MGVPSRQEIAKTIKVSKADGGAISFCLNVSKDGETDSEPLNDMVDVSQVLSDAKSAGVFVIGRHKEGLDLVLKHDTISRVHAVLLCGGIKRTFYVVDWGSSKGTKLNDVAVEPHIPTTLKDGDILRFGKSSRKYTVTFGDRESMAAPVARASDSIPIATTDADTRDNMAAPESELTSAGEAGDVKNDASRIPTSEYIDLNGHTKPAVALTIDTSGARLVTGGLDFMLHLYDFAGMTSSFRPFKSLEPEAAHAITWTQFSPGGDMLALSTADSAVRTFTRDGELLDETVKGDMYIRDLMHTKGHIMPITQVAWHPNPKKTDVLKGVYMSSSEDGSLRLWSMAAPRIWGKLVNRYVIKPRSVLGTKQRVGLRCCLFSPCGTWILAGDAEGSIFVYKHMVHSHEYSTDGGCAKIKSIATSSSTAVGNAFAFPMQRPFRVLRAGVEQSARAMCSLVHHEGAGLVAARYEDSEVRVWRWSQLTGAGAVSAAPGKPTYCEPMLSFSARNEYPEANVCFSPDGTYLLAAEALLKGHKGTTSVTPSLQVWSLRCHPPQCSRVPLTSDADEDKGQGGGEESGDGGPLLGRRHVYGGIMTAWNSKINQIIVTLCTGSVRVFYDRDLSSRGAMMPVSRVGNVKRRDVVVSEVPARIPDSMIITPGALPMFKEHNIAIKGNKIVTGAAAREVAQQKKRNRDGTIVGERQMLPLKPSTQGPGKSVIANSSFKYANFKQTNDIHANDPVAALHALDGKEEDKRHPRFFDGEVRILADRTYEDEVDEAKKLAKMTAKGKNKRLDEL